MGKSKLLVRSSRSSGGKSGKEKPKLEDGDEFSVSDKFSPTHTKFKIQTAKATSGERDPAQTRQVVLEDRKHEIDAAVVRIMKARRTEGHNNLVNEVTGTLINRFKADARDVKKRIEYLIEREFLERSPTDQ